jgi:receptor protein-tyrosine kinase
MDQQRLGVVLWRGKWFVLASLAIGIALAVLVTKQATKVYEAHATIQVISGGGGANAVSPSDVVAANQGLAQTYATLIADQSFLGTIRARVLGGRVSTGELASRVSASAVPNTALVKLIAQGASPDEARSVAMQVANGFVSYLRSNADARSTVLQAQVQRQLRRLNDQITAGGSAERIATLRAQRTQLSQELESIVAAQIAQAGSVSVTGQATASSAPVKPRKMLNLVAGALLGLLVGFGAAYLRAYLDRGLHSAAEAEELLDAPVLASIPLRRRYANDDPVLGEAYDVLRANLAFLALDTPMQVITFSSANPREGKTSSVEGLAYAAVRGGMSVLVVDGDVRTRSLSHNFGREDAPGLSSIVVGMATPEEAMVEVLPRLTLLPAGPMPPNPPSLLSSGRLRDAVDEFRGQFDLVLIDSPPAAQLADAALLASVSDGVVVVARVGVSARVDLPRVLANLRHSPTPVAGVVVLEHRPVDDKYYPAMTKGAPVVSDTPVAP